MKQVWELEHKGRKVLIETTDREGHTAYKTWEKGAVFFKGKPVFSEVMVSKVEFKKNAGD